VSERLREILDELRELGGEPLAQRWPAIRELRRLAEHEDAESVERIRSTANAIYGGYGSFADYGISGPDADRFERLKDELSREIGRL
jgi:hypothetical protein